MTNREKLHRLMEELSEAEVAPTLRLLETQRHDPLMRALANAPSDEQTYRDDEARSDPA